MLDECSPESPHRRSPRRCERFEPQSQSDQGQRRRHKQQPLARGWRLRTTRSSSSGHRQRRGRRGRFLWRSTATDGINNALSNSSSNKHICNNMYAPCFECTRSMERNTFIQSKAKSNSPNQVGRSNSASNLKQFRSRGTQSCYRHLKLSSETHLSTCRTAFQLLLPA